MLRDQELLEMERPVSARHAPMRRCDRAAQFAPFAALSGFDETVQEVGRLTQARIELAENEREALNPTRSPSSGAARGPAHLFSARCQKIRRDLPHDPHPRPQA